MAEKILFALMGAVLGLSGGYFLGQRSSKTPEIVSEAPLAQCNVAGGAPQQSPSEAREVAPISAVAPISSAVAPVPSTVAQSAPAEVTAKKEESPQRSAPMLTSPTPPLENVRSESEIKEFLKAAEIRDLYQNIPDSIPITNRRGELDYLNGRFVGVAQVVDDGRNESWDVTLTLDGKIVSGKLAGVEEIVLSVNGRVFSKKAGNGTLKDFRELPGDDKMLLVETGPNTYLQLYYLKSSDAIIGNVYRPNEGQPRLIPVGTVQLYRR